MDIRLKWDKNIAHTGDWMVLVRAASEVEVRELHDEEQRLPASARHLRPCLTNASGVSWQKYKRVFGKEASDSFSTTR